MFDLAQDLRTGDLMFGPSRDLLAAVDDRVIKQRIRARLVIPRGTWLYDDDSTLGSMLYVTTSYLPERALREIPALARDALSFMPDIRVTDVAVRQNVDDATKIEIQISYQPITINDRGETVTAANEAVFNLPVA